MYTSRFIRSLMSKMSAVCCFPAVHSFATNTYCVPSRIGQIEVLLNSNRYCFTKNDNNTKQWVTNPGISSELIANNCAPFANRMEQLSDEIGDNFDDCRKQNQIDCPGSCLNVSSYIAIGFTKGNYSTYQIPFDIPSSLSKAMCLSDKTVSIITSSKQHLKPNQVKNKIVNNQDEALRIEAKNSSFHTEILREKIKNAVPTSQKSFKQIDCICNKKVNPIGFSVPHESRFILNRKLNSSASSILNKAAWTANKMHTRKLSSEFPEFPDYVEIAIIGDLKQNPSFYPDRKITCDLMNCCELKIAQKKAEKLRKKSPC